MMFASTQFQGAHISFAISIIADKFYMAAYAIKCEVASKCQCLKDLNFFVIHSEHARTSQLAQYRYYIQLSEAIASLTPQTSETLIFYYWCPVKASRSWHTMLYPCRTRPASWLVDASVTASP